MATALLICLWQTGANAQTTITLGDAQSFTVLGGSTVTNTGPTAINGDVGVSPGTSITGFPPGTVTNGAIHSDDTLAAQAHISSMAAYNAVAAEMPTANLTGQDLGGLTLTPGVYRFNTAAQLTGALKLNNVGIVNAPFHFLIGSTLVTAANSSVQLLGGPDPNIYWQVGSSATLGVGAAFSGNILAFASITFNTGASLVGRAQALNGAVTLDTNSLTNLDSPAGVVVTGSTVVVTGSLSGVGSIPGSVVTSGAVTPGIPGLPGALHIAGDFTQTPTGTLNIQLASPTNYDRVTTGGNATLGGHLVVSYLDGFRAAPGDVFEIITAGAGVSGKFATFDDPNATGTLLTLGVTYEKNDVLLQYIQGSFASLPLNGVDSANELAVAHALDRLAARGPGNSLIADLDSLQLAQLPGALILLSPEDLTSAFTAGLAVSQVQTYNMELRLDNVRQGATGFSDSGFAVSGNTPDSSKDVVDSKAIKESFLPRPKTTAAGDSSFPATANGAISATLPPAAAPRSRRAASLWERTTG